MIELKNISARQLIPIEDCAAKRLLENNHITSAEDVLNIINKYPEYDWTYVVKRLNKIKKEMNIANKNGFEPKMFYTKGYTNKELLKQDLINYGNILLVDNPTHFNTRYTYLKNKTIEQIKIDLAHTTSFGKNFISSNYGYKNIGVTSIPRIISLIEMYEEQIERQSKLTTTRDINLFNLDKNLKMLLIEEMYKEIITYLLDNADKGFVWSDLTDVQKKLYLSSAINTKLEDLNIKEKVIEYISNYTTVPELNNITNHELKVLKRFITK